MTSRASSQSSLTSSYRVSSSFSLVREDAGPIDPAHLQLVQGLGGESCDLRAWASCAETNYLEPK